MAVSEKNVTGRFYRIWSAADKLWHRMSFWTHANDVEFNDGKTAQTKVGAIKGITTSTSATETGYAADATTVAALNQSLGNLNQNLFNNGTVSFYVIAGKQDGWMTFSTLPFLRADLYNITLISQNLLGTLSTATFSNSRFEIRKTKYGINLISNDGDVNSWFKAGSIYEFKCSFTKI